MRLRVFIAGAAVVCGAAILVPLAPAARSHTFKATYTGHGSGQASASGASGHASATGRASLMGSSTLRGSAAGSVVSAACFSVNGNAVLRGSTGSITIAASGVHVCAPAGGGSSTAFSGRARVTGGTGRFAGARGTLGFHGVYVQATGAVTISFKGALTY